jgi:hypothetical protein
MKIKSFMDLFIDSNDSFEGQQKGEDVILILRRHVFVIYSQLAVFIIAIFVPLIIGKAFHDFISINSLFTEFIFVSSVWYMFSWIMVFYALTMYSLNVVIVTNHRIIDSRQKGFFDRKISEFHLSKVQDITVHTRGIIETMLKFGSIEVQTASEERQFIFNQLPNPEHVKDVIMDLADLDIPRKNPEIQAV